MQAKAARAVSLRERLKLTEEERQRLKNKLLDIDSESKLFAELFRSYTEGSPLQLSPDQWKNLAACGQRVVDPWVQTTAQRQAQKNQPLAVDKAHLQKMLDAVQR
jgi:hypothetical protein